MRRGWWLAAVAGLLVALGLGACGGGGGDSSSKSSDPPASETASARNGSASSKQEAEASAPVTEREITYTASLVVLVGDAERATTRAAAIAEAADGYLAGQEADLEGRRQSTLTLRVPSTAFRSVLHDLAELGKVQDQSIDSDDVTNEVVDLRGRLKSQEASVARLRSFLADAGSTSDLLVIEQELAKRQSEIESLEGRLRVLDDQVGLATITASLTEKVEPVPDKSPPGVVDGLRAGTSTLFGIGRVVAVSGAFLLPFVPLALLAWFGFRLWRRRHTKRVVAPAGPWATTPHPPVPVGAAAPGAGVPPPPAGPPPGRSSWPPGPPSDVT